MLQEEQGKMTLLKAKRNQSGKKQHLRKLPKRTIEMKSKSPCAHENGQRSNGKFENDIYHPFSYGLKLTIVGLAFRLSMGSVICVISIVCRNLA